MVFVVDHVMTACGQAADSDVDIAQITKHCASNLEKVDSIMASVDDGYMGHMTNAIIDSVISVFQNGKRLRPMVSLLIGEALNKFDDNNVILAAASELIHIATLLHDDVVDNSGLRRGVATINRTFNNKTSILAGDFLLGTAFNLLLSLENNQILKIMTKCTIHMAQGELAQLNANGNYDMTIDDYISMAEAKTALLFSSIAESAAVLANYHEADRLAEFGRNLGIAFQIIDDVLDYTGPTAEAAKQTGCDFKNGLVTLPAILAIGAASQQERIFWIKSFSDPRKRTDEALCEAKSYIAAHDSINQSVEIAVRYAKKARRAAETLTSSRARDMLLSLTRFATKRMY